MNTSSKIKTFGIGDKVWQLYRLYPSKGSIYKSNDCKIFQRKIKEVMLIPEPTNDKRSLWNFRIEYRLDNGTRENKSYVFKTLKDAKIVAGLKNLHIVEVVNSKKLIERNLRCRCEQ